jgi:hypothetical protein
MTVRKNIKITALKIKLTIRSPKGNIDGITFAAFKDRHITEKDKSIRARASTRVT